MDTLNDLRSKVDEVLVTERKEHGTTWLDAMEKQLDILEETLGITTPDERRMVAMACGASAAIVAAHGDSNPLAALTDVVVIEVLSGMAARLLLRAEAQEAAEQLEAGQ